MIKFLIRSCVMWDRLNEAQILAMWKHREDPGTTVQKWVRPSSCAEIAAQVGRGVSPHSLFGDGDFRYTAGDVAYRSLMEGITWLEIIHDKMPQLISELYRLAPMVRWLTSASIQLENAENAEYAERELREDSDEAPDDGSSEDYYLPASSIEGYLSPEQLSCPDRPRNYDLVEKVRRCYGYGAHYSFLGLYDTLLACVKPRSSQDPSVTEPAHRDLINATFGWKPEVIQEKLTGSKLGAPRHKIP